MSSIFLCHSTADKEFVRRLADALRRAGAHVWLDEVDLHVGESTFDRIGGGIREMRYVGIVLSPQSVASRWVKQELHAALDRELREDTVVVLPILLEDVEIPTFLSGRIYADFRTPEKAPDGFRRLCNALGLSRGAEWDTPGPPAHPTPAHAVRIRPADAPAQPLPSRPADPDPDHGGPRWFPDARSAPLSASPEPAAPPAARRTVPPPPAVRSVPRNSAAPQIVQTPRTAEQLLKLLLIGKGVADFHYQPASTLPIVGRAKRVCRVPAGEQVLAVLDLEGWNFWIPPSQLAVFTDQGVYVSTKTRTSRGWSSIPYHNIVGSTISVSERAEDHIRYFVRYFDISIGPRKISVRADERGALLRKLLEQLS